MTAQDHPQAADPPAAPRCAPSAVVGFHRLTPSKAQRVLPWVMSGIAVTQLALGIEGPFAQPWWSLLWLTFLASAVLQAVSLRRMGTEVSPTGLRVHTGLRQGRWVPWAQVSQVKAPKPFEQTWTASLVTGRRLALHGLPAAAAQALLDSALAGPGSDGTRPLSG